MDKKELIRQLREETGASLSACNKALESCGNNLDEAKISLRKKGLADAAKKQDRAAENGLVGVLTKGHAGFIVEMNCQTDFVARNEQFQNIVNNVLNALEAHRIEDVDALLEKGEPSLKEQILEGITKIGENLICRRVACLEVDPGIVMSYVHNAVPGAAFMGKIGVLVALQSPAPADKLEPLGKFLAMHIAAKVPGYLQIADIPEDVVEAERSVLVAQLEDSQKPKDIIDKMVIGRLQKFYKEHVLEEQPYLKDDKLTVKEEVQRYAKEIGHPIELKAFLRIELGK